MTDTDGDVAEIAALLREASRDDRPVEVVGRGRHAGRGGAVEPGIPVRAPSGVVTHDPADLTCRVRAATSLRELAAVLAEADQELPVSGIEADATLGGVLAAGVSSRRRLRTGPLRDRVLQLELVTGDGRVIKAGGPTVKNVSGFDLCRLVCGSLGTLGVITEVIVKVTPKPPARAWFVAPARSAEEAFALGGEALDALYAPAAVEVVGPGWTVQVLLEGHAGDVAEQARRLPPGFVEDLPVRDPYELAVEVAVPPDALGAVVGGLPWSRGVRAQLGIGLAWLSIAGDEKDLRETAESRGGRLHTLRPLPGVDPFGTPPAGAVVMQRIKWAFDPAGVLNRGRIPFLEDPLVEGGARRQRRDQGRPGGGALPYRAGRARSPLEEGI